MTNGIWLAMSAVCGLMATSVASASLISIDANAYTSGTDVSNAFTGVTLSHLTWTSAGKQNNPVYAAECADVSNPGSPCSAIGPASFGRMTSASTVSPSWFSSSSVIINCLKQNHSYCYSTPQHLLEVSFGQATDFVTLDSTHLSDWPYVWALDAAGNKLTVTVDHVVHQAWGPGGGPFGYRTVTITSATSNIARIVVAGNGGYVSVDTISYEAP